MAIQKVESLLIGGNDLITNTSSCFVFTSVLSVQTHNVLQPYITNSVVEYDGKYWKAIQNLPVGPNATPDVDTANWVLLYKQVKDGDVAHIVSGANSNIEIRKNGIWLSLLDAPIEGSLTNNATGQLLISFPILTSRAATIEYYIENNSAYRTGTLRYISNSIAGPTGVSLSDNGIVDIGGDVGITFDAQVDGLGANVQLTYDSSVVGPPGLIKYLITRWS